MDYIKLQNDLMKAAFNRDEKYKEFLGFYLKKECEIVCGLNRSQAFVIPNDSVYIDVDKIFKGREVPTFDNVLYKIQTDESYSMLKDTGVIEQRTVGKKKIQLLVYENTALNEKIYLDKKLFKYYDTKNLVLYGGNCKQPVRVYEDTEFIGVLAPVWIQD